MLDRGTNHVSGDQPAALAKRIREIDDQLLTRAPTALDGALLLVERKSAYEALNPDAQHGGDRKSSRYREIKTKSISFCSDAAERLGLSERAIQLAVSMGEAIAPYSDQLRQTPIVDNAKALRDFAGLEARARDSVLRLWTENPKLSFSGALVAARLRSTPDSDETAFQTLVSAWSRAPSKARRRFLAHIDCDATEIEAIIAAWRKRGVE